MQCGAKVALPPALGPQTGALSEDWDIHHKKSGLERFDKLVPSGTEFMEGKYDSGTLLKHV